jgi:RNA-directed DNA polymerase
VLRRESDEPIVPRKPVKAGGGKGLWFWALSKKGRIRRLGNLETPDTIRSLQRKLYLKAKSESGYRFYLLYDKLYRGDILLHAYRVAKANGGAAGVDGVDFEQIDREGAGAFLAKLQEELKKQEYRPMPVRRVYIPKPNGGERPLGIPCIRDRVVQTAANLVLQPIFEADLTDNAYAYRPRKSAQEAVRRVHALLREGYTDVVDADLSKYFDEIPHAELMKSVARRISDTKVLKLIKLWLKAPIEERDEKGNSRLTGGKGQQKGTPQGGVASPLLANIYMRRFLLAWQQRQLTTKLNAYVVNYADDFVILCRGTAQKAREAADQIITGMKLRMNQEKTRVVDASRQPFDFLGYTFGPCYGVRSPEVYLGVRPSKTRIKRLYGKVREHLSSANTDPLEEVMTMLNSMLVGWAQYFSYGTLTKAYRAVDWLVQGRLRGWLCRRHKVQGRGTRRFPTDELYSKFGLVCLDRLLATRRSNA